jgi:protein SCO1/2
MHKLLWALTLAFAIVSCTQTPREEAKAKTSVEVYEVKGEVLGMNPVQQTVLLKHEAIKGWMDAMTMEFPVKEKSDFEKFAPKQKIVAKVNVQGTEYWLSNIVWVP